MAAPLLLGVGLVLVAAPLLLLLLLLLLLAATTHRRSALGAHAPPRGVPTPAGAVPLLGHGLEVARNRHRLHDWLLETTLRLGKEEEEEEEEEEEVGGEGAQKSRNSPRTWVFTTPLNPIYVVVSSPAALEHVLSSRGMDTYVKGPQFRARLGDLLGGGIFTADGAQWRWQRKLAAHLFSAARFREFVASAFAASVDHLFDALEPYAAASEAAAAAAAAAEGAGRRASSPAAASPSLSPSSSASCPPSADDDLLLAAAAAAAASPPSVDLHALMYDLTLDTFARVGFGVELGMLEAAADEARRSVAAAAVADSGESTSAPPADEGDRGGRAALINGVSGRAFAHAFDEAQRLANRRFWLPLWRLVELATGDAARVRRDVRLVRAFAEGIVRQRRALMAKEGEGGEGEEAAGAAASSSLPRRAVVHAHAGGDGNGGEEAAAAAAVEKETASRPDLLTLFMRPGALASSSAARSDSPTEAAAAAAAAGGGGGGGDLTDAEVVDAVLNFIIASRDTTAQATSWAFYELMRHPDVEAKLLAEADEVLGPLRQQQQQQQQRGAGAGAGAAAGPGGGGGGGGEAPPRQQQQHHHQHPTYDQLRALRYARAVFLEVCRLHPSIPQDCKYAARGDVLPDGTPVPRGALLLYSPYVVCRLPSFWGDDAAEFRPERWLKGGGGGGGGGAGSAGFLAPSPYSFPAFNAGPRLCLGRGFAELEGAFALVETLRRYRLRPAPGCEHVTYAQSTSLPMLGGLRVCVTRRQQQQQQQQAAAV